jgi:hypothetical protein
MWVNVLLLPLLFVVCQLCSDAAVLPVLHFTNYLVSKSICFFPWLFGKLAGNLRMDSEHGSYIYTSDFWWHVTVAQCID